MLHLCFFFNNLKYMKFSHFYSLLVVVLPLFNANSQDVILTINVNNPGNLHSDIEKLIPEEYRDYDSLDTRSTLYDNTIYLATEIKGNQDYTQNIFSFNLYTGVLEHIAGLCFDCEAFLDCLR